MEQLEIFDESTWEDDNQTITRDTHGISGLGNFCHRRIRSNAAPSPLHYHSDIMEIHCLIKGQRRTVLERPGERSTHLITGNEVFITFPYELHGNGNEPCPPSEYYGLQLNIREREQFLGLNQKYGCALCDDLLALKKRHFQISATDISMLKRAFNLFSGETDTDRRDGIFLLTAFLSSLSHMLPVERSESVTENKKIRPALTYIESHLDENISMETLAKECGYSLSHFKAKFRDCVGITPNEYIISRKIEAAKHRLETTEIPVTELAFTLGFSSSNYFASVFKKTMNCTPSAYRNEYRNYQHTLKKTYQ